MQDPLDTDQQVTELVEPFRRKDIIGPPYRVSALLKYSKVIEVQEAETDTDGYTIPFDGYYIIGVNSRHSFYRKRFTCCHELAHTLLMERERAGYMRPHSSYSFEEEKLCDRIAAELLLPRAVFIKYLKNRRPSISALFELSKEFLVSIDVIITRIIDMDVWNIKFIIWKAISQANGVGTYSIKKAFGCGQDSMRRVNLSRQCIESVHKSYTRNVYTRQQLGSNLLMESVRRMGRNEYHVLSIIREQ
jgi:Zn-dependent peptidase ImmA (M78 family)